MHHTELLSHLEMMPTHDRVHLPTSIRFFSSRNNSLPNSSLWCPASQRVLLLFPLLGHGASWDTLRKTTELAKRELLPRRSSPNSDRPSDNTAQWSKAEVKLTESPPVPSTPAGDGVAAHHPHSERDGLSHLGLFLSYLCEDPTVRSEMYNYRTSWNINSINNNTKILQFGDRQY